MKPAKNGFWKWAGILSVLSLFLLASLPIMHAATIDDGINNVGNKARDILENFYSRYTKATDFTLLFIMFTVMFFIGLKQAFASSDGISRQIAILAAVLGLICSIALVFGMGFSIVKLKYIALGLLYFIITFLIYSMLLKMGMEEHKFWAFLLAALLTLLLFWLGAKLMGLDGLGSGSGSGSMGSGSGSDGTASSSSSSGGGLFGWLKNMFNKNDNTDGKIVYKICDSGNMGADAFVWATSEFKSSGEETEIKTFVAQCVDTIAVFGYSSTEGGMELNAGLSQDRAEKVSQVIQTTQKNVAEKTGKGSTWEFSPTATNEQKKQALDEFANSGKYDNPILNANRAYRITCKCIDEEKTKQTNAGSSGKTESENTNNENSPDSCEQLSSQYNIKNLWDKMTETTSEKLTRLEGILATCKAEYNSQEGNMKTIYLGYYKKAFFELYYFLAESSYSTGSISDGTSYIDRILKNNELEFTDDQISKASSLKNKYVDRVAGCLERKDFNIREFLRNAKEMSQDLWNGQGQTELKKAEDTLNLCLAEYRKASKSASDPNQVIQIGLKEATQESYFEFYTELAQIWFKFGDYSRSKQSLQNILDDKGDIQINLGDGDGSYVQKTLSVWYDEIVPDHYNKQIILQRIDAAVDVNSDIDIATTRIVNLVDIHKMMSQAAKDRYAKKLIELKSYGDQTTK